MTSYLLAGGGTAGHVNPLLSIADALRDRRPADTVIALGTAEGLEARLVPERGHRLECIPKVAFPRRLDIDALTFPTRFRGAVERVRVLMRRHRTDVLVGFGGYVSAPAYAAARREGIPYVVHEANVRPGLANLWGARGAAAVGTVFPGTRLRGFQRVGMPLRAEIATLTPAAVRTEAAAEFGLDAARPVLLAFGGSAGARSINTAVAGAWPALRLAGWQLLHLTGDARFAEVDVAPADGRAVLPYASRMELAYALADFALCRSGAATVSELSALGIPAAYVPYPVGNGEQTRNAAAAVTAGSAILIPDAELNSSTIARRLLPLLSDGSKQARMRHAASELGVRDGTHRLIELIDEASA